MGEKDQAVFEAARTLFETSPDWVTFFREVLGTEGLVRKSFSDAESLGRFEKSERYREIQQLLARLRARRDNGSEGTEPTRVITVRLPQSVHELLQAEAHEQRTSMNKLCISKLVRMIDGEFVPTNARREAPVCP